MGGQAISEDGRMLQGPKVSCGLVLILNPRTQKDRKCGQGRETKGVEVLCVSCFHWSRAQGLQPTVRGDDQL